jgi:deoxyribodipyrimidine photo-lyase
MSHYKRSLVWIRRDLRTHDHRAWSEAEEASDEIAVVFVFDSNILKKISNKQDRRLTFIFESLAEIDAQLRAKGSQLVVLQGDPMQEIPQLAQNLNIDAVFTNRDHEPYALKRDSTVQRKLKESGKEFLTFKDQVIFEAQEVKNLAGDYFKVFTPFSKAWRAKLGKHDVEEARVRLKNLISSQKLQKVSQKLELESVGFHKTKNWIEGGTKGALQLKKSFLKNIKDYKNNRDLPALSEGTSHLSVHLRFGTLNPRELFRETWGLQSTGAITWQNELIWREFYQMLLQANPSLPDNCFQEKCNSIKWPGTQKDFQAWCEGQTGYPIVDAAMRHFNKTGWMHNRLRMIVASFLTKDLLCSWKWGEKYFADHLLDFDLASNNGGWQWAASVGCDAQPYFRIFNPVLQSERFDTEGVFLKAELPELKKLPLKYLHAPWTATPMELLSAGVKLGDEYPHPIVNHAEQKDKAIKLFKP